ncbi:fus1 actin binding activity protein [Blastocladiella emersonii ATCC 22665]|nr:fus1 actin binding activity protein [Blastocladiella emersonii ATCC 22665]
MHHGSHAPAMILLLLALFTALVHADANAAVCRPLPGHLCAYRAFTQPVPMTRPTTPADARRAPMGPGARVGTVRPQREDPPPPTQSPLITTESAFGCGVPSVHAVGGTGLLYDASSAEVTGDWVDARVDAIGSRVRTALAGQPGIGFARVDGAATYLRFVRTLACIETALEIANATVEFACIGARPTSRQLVRRDGEVAGNETAPADPPPPVPPAPACKLPVNSRAIDSLCRAFAASVLDTAIAATSSPSSPAPLSPRWDHEIVHAALPRVCPPSLDLASRISAVYLEGQASTSGSPSAPAAAAPVDDDDAAAAVPRNAVLDLVVPDILLAAAPVFTEHEVLGCGLHAPKFRVDAAPSVVTSPAAAGAAASGESIVVRARGRAALRLSARDTSAAQTDPSEPSYNLAALCSHRCGSSACSAFASTSAGPPWGAILASALGAFGVLVAVTLVLMPWGNADVRMPAHERAVFRFWYGYAWVRQRRWCRRRRRGRGKAAVAAGKQGVPPMMVTGRPVLHYGAFGAQLGAYPPPPLALSGRATDVSSPPPTPFSPVSPPPTPFSPTTPTTDPGYASALRPSPPPPPSVTIPIDPAATSSSQTLYHHHHPRTPTAPSPTASIPRLSLHRLPPPPLILADLGPPRRVTYAYTAAHGDELDLVEGDYVHVRYVFEDAWADGVNLTRGGKEGVFPLVCTEEQGEVRLCSALVAADTVSAGPVPPKRRARQMGDRYPRSDSLAAAGRAPSSASAVSVVVALPSPAATLESDRPPGRRGSAAATPRFMDVDAYSAGLPPAAAGFGAVFGRNGARAPAPL